MNIDKTIDIVGQFDIQGIREIVLSLDKEWFDNTQRQDRFPSVQGETVSVFISDHDAIDWNGEDNQTIWFDVQPRLLELVRPIIKSLEDKFNGKVGKCLFIKLPAGKHVYEHTDNGHYLHSVHRCHIPIVTNSSVFFTVDETTINMQEGTCYEINNTLPHKVDNDGSTDRIHLLIDIIPLEKIMRV